MGDLIRAIIKWIIVILIIILTIFIFIKVTNKKSNDPIDSGVKKLKTIKSNIEDGESIIPDNNSSTSENTSTDTNNQNNTNNTTNSTTATNVQITNTGSDSYLWIIGLVIISAGGCFVVKTKKYIEN